MPDPIARRSKNSQFSHAAFAMGAFWAGVRKNEAQRIEKLRQVLVAGTRRLVVPEPGLARAGGALPPA